MKQLWAWLLSGGGGIAFIWIIAQFFIDRRDKKSQRAVATKTLPLQIEQVGLQNFEERLATLARLQDEAQEMNEQTIASLRREVSDCRVRITTLEQRVQADATWKRAATSYIRILRSTINELRPGHPVPAMPVGLELLDE
jgi:small-conductance mechanosensitive channel